MLRIELEMASVTGPIMDMPPAQFNFVPRESGNIAQDFDMPPVTDGMGVHDFSFSGLELGQFFVPDEFERWVSQGTNRPEQ